MPDIQIKAASTETDFDATQELFREYAESLPFDLAYQNFEGEMAAFPGKYAEPQGCLLVVEVDDMPMGAVGLRPLERGVAEIQTSLCAAWYSWSRSRASLGGGDRRAWPLDRLPDAPPRYDPRIDGRCGAGVSGGQFR